MLENNIIPKRFKLFGQIIEVVLDEKYFERDGQVGFASYRANEIRLKPNKYEDQLSATFWHELTHFVLLFAQASRNQSVECMHQDEDFVELVSNLYHQAITTMEF